MQTIRFQCPRCHSALRVSVKYAGHDVKCPQPACKKTITIPLFSDVDKNSDEKKPSAEQLKPKQKKRASPKKTPPVKTPLVKTKRSKKSSTKPASRKRTHSHFGSPNRRKVAAILCAVLICGAFSYFLLPENASDNPEQDHVAIASKLKPYNQTAKPFFAKYCNECHGEDIQEGGIRLDQFKSTPDILGEHELWSKIHQQISVGSMPPQDADAPQKEERQLVANWLDQKVNHFDCKSVDHPGRVTVHRLNRVEYDNTIRDLLGVELHLSNNFPSDDSGYGFDNIGDVLTTSPILMERYLDAAEIASRAAIILPESLQINQKYRGKSFRVTGAGRASEKEVSFISDGAAVTTFKVISNGTHEFELNVSATQSGKGTAKCRIFLDDKEISYPQIPGHHQKKTIRFQKEIASGSHKLRIVFDNDDYTPAVKDPKRRDRNLYLHFAQIKGPISLTEDQFPASYKKIILARPSKNLPAAEAAKLVLSPLLQRAFRRPATKQEQQRILKIFNLVYEKEKHYERSLQIALQAILVSPQFLFRLEQDSNANNNREKDHLDDYELASRLSYFLWSSMPDAELFTLAQKGVLHQDDVLEKQVRRMLVDKKAVALTQNFVGQWLGLRKLSDQTPDKNLFPMFNQKLATAMEHETILLFNHVLKNDLSFMELISANYTFVNQTLAEFYGIKGVKGNSFQKVDLSQTPRRGLIAHAGILTLTSYPNRTSPVKRGEWVLENILGQAPPPAPPTVPSLDITQKSNPNMSLREQLLLHQKEPICSSCHILMDGIGFGLQNFDAIGRWREMDGKYKIDAQGDLPDGSSFEGPVELIQILKKRPDDFAKCLSEKMLTYALGRGLQWYDRCTIDDIVAKARKDDYRLSCIIVEIVRSDPFRKRREEGK